MTERRRSSFDGHELLLVSTHRQATVMHVLLTLAARRASWPSPSSPTVTRAAVTGVVIAVVLTALFGTVSVVWVRRQPVPTLRVRTDGIEARSYGSAGCTALPSTSRT